MPSIPALVTAAVVFVACRSVPLPSDPLTDAQDQVIADAFSKAVRVHRPLIPLALAAALPLPAQVLNEGQLSVTIEGHLGAVKTRDGSWIVQVPGNGSARIVAYSTTSGQVGAAMNPRGYNQTNIHTQQLVLPRAIATCDSLVVTSTGSGPRDSYWAYPGRSVVDEAMAVVFVPYAATPGLLRPPAIGDGYLPRWFRSQPIPEAMINMAKLPSLINVDALPVNWSAWGAAKPDLAYLHALLRPMGGEFYDGWNTDTRTPDNQHPGYGTAYASVVSQALVQLCSTATTQAKQPLAIAVVQRGLDLVGAFCDGRANYPLGGHMQGRKALVVMCGHLLGIEPFADPTTYIGDRFQEDGYFLASPAAWWFGAGWIAGWSFQPEAPFNGAKLADPPSTWGSVQAPLHDTWAWMVAGYLQQGVGSQIGTGLAMRLMGLEREMGHGLVQMINQWMDGPPAAANAQLLAVGITLPWGTDYALVKGVGFCAAAWNAMGF